MLAGIGLIADVVGLAGAVQTSSGAAAVTAGDLRLFLIFIVVLIVGVAITVWFILFYQFIKAEERIEKLEKVVSADYKNKSWSDDERETNVLFIIRENDLKATNESFSGELKTATEKLAKLENRVKKLEPPELTDDAIMNLYTK